METTFDSFYNIGMSSTKMRSFKRISLVLIITINFFWLESISQSPSYVHYSSVEGLPTSEVYDLYQDKTGFIWMATANGVVRYDGYEMKIFRADGGLDDPVVFGLFEDAKNRIWFRTYSGKLYYYERGKIKNYKYNDLLSQANSKFLLLSMHVDSLDQVWYGTNFSMGKISNEGDILRENDGLLFLKYKEIGSGSVTGYWGPAGKIRKAKVNDKIFDVVQADTINNNLIVCSSKWRGKLYFSIASTIFEVRETSFKEVFRGHNQIISLYTDHDENLWIGSAKGGVVGERNSSFKDTLSLPFLQGKSITKVIQDSQNGYWFSTLEDGVYHVPNMKVISFRNIVQSKIKVTLSVENQTFIGDDQGNLITLSNKNGKVTKSEKFDRVILNIFGDSKKNLWVSTAGPTYIFDSLANLRKRYTTSIINCLSEDDRGIVWGVGSDNICKFTLCGKEFLHESKKVKSIHRAILCDDSLIITSARTGLEIFDYDQNTIKTPTLFGSYKVSKLLNLNDSILLFGTIGSGFFIVNKRDWSFEHYHIGKNFIANDIYSLLKIDSNLWLGTEAGIAVTSISSLIANSPNFSFFTKQQGLTGSKVDHLTYTYPNIWAFSEHGFSILYRDAVTSNRQPSFYIKEILASNVPVANHSRLPYDQNNIKIAFGFISFPNQNIFIRSRLSKYDQWLYSKERSLNFYSLHSGEYFFELEYSVDNRTWYKATTNFDFIILPVWWRAWYIQLTYFALIFFIFYYFVRSRVSSLKQKQEYLNTVNKHQKNMIRAEIGTLEKERTRIAKDLHDSIGMNLTVIKMSIGHLFRKTNEPTANAVLEQLQTTLDEIKDIVQNLTPSGIDRYGLVEVLKNHIDKLNGSSHTVIELHSFGPVIKYPQISLLSFRIIQELINNSLKHAKARLIKIHINSTDDWLNIMYDDDGIGFNFESVQKGSGLFNIESRIQAANGSLKFESGSFGTSFTIDVPIK